MKAKMIISSKFFKKLLKTALPFVSKKTGLDISISADSYLMIGIQAVSIEGNGIAATTLLDYDSVIRLIKILKAIQNQPITVTFNDHGFNFEG